MLTRRFAQGRLTRLPDELAVEEPLSIRLDDILVTTTMRTPGNDFELAAGFCLTEGLLEGATIKQLRYCSDDASEKASFNVVTVDTGGTAPTPTPRLGLTSSSCGLCGSESIDALCARLRPVTRGNIPISVLADISSRLEGQQPLFAKTGAVHAAAVFDAHGTISIVREDIGRHNAVDKVIGQLLLDGQLPATGLGLFVSGRGVVRDRAKGLGRRLCRNRCGERALRAGRRHGPSGRHHTGGLCARATFQSLHRCWSRICRAVTD